MLRRADCRALDMPGQLRLRIALDATFAGANRSGVGIYSHELMRALGAEAAREGYEVRCYGPACAPLTTVGGLLHTMQEWPVNTQLALPLALHSFRPHIVHATSHLSPLWGPGKLVVTVHDLIFLRFPQDYNPVWLAISRALLPAVLKRASAIVADSAITKHDLIRHYGIEGTKVEVAYPGIDERLRTAPSAEQRHKVSQRFGLEAGSYILCLGAWVKRKNLPVVIEAFSRLSACHPSVQLALTGERPRGMKAEREQSLLNALPADVRDRVRALGFVERASLPALIAGAAIVAYPSLYEGFGLPAIEAMAAGAPVVVSDAPTLAEVTAGAALVAGRHDPSAWAAAFERILADRSEAERLREAGRRRSSLFSWGRCAAQVISVYKRVAKASRA